MSIPMNAMTRRDFLWTAAILPLALATAGQSTATAAPQEQLAQLEKTAGGRLGVCAIDMSHGAQISHRGDERFPLCSTFKVILVAAILTRSSRVDGLMQRRVYYKRSDLAAYSPMTERHIVDGMTVAELCAAALQYSDNTAANILIGIVGGPAAVTEYARSIGNAEFRLDRWETDLNSSTPGDLRDTATPASMAHSLQALSCGDALPPAQTQQLNEWLRGNTTGAKRIRAAVPADWSVGDKTGSGDYGVTNDIAVLWPPQRQPIVVALYYTQDEPTAQWRDEVIAAAARIVVDGFIQSTRRPDP